MYFPDLSTYHYAAKIEVKGVVNVGWLDDRYEYPRGRVPSLVVRKLQQILIDKRDITTMDGITPCTFCPSEEVYLDIPETRRLLGITEIWIPAKSGIIYASPSLIYHFITEHQYKPPQQYLDAVSEFDLASNWDGEQVLDELLKSQKDSAP